jgi:hypothetical protein
MDLDGPTSAQKGRRSRRQPQRRPSLSFRYPHPAFAISCIDSALEREITKQMQSQVEYFAWRFAIFVFAEEALHIMGSLHARFVDEKMRGLSEVCASI